MTHAEKLSSLMFSWYFGDEMDRVEIAEAIREVESDLLLETIKDMNCAATLLNKEGFVEEVEILSENLDYWGIIGVYTREDLLAHLDEETFYRLYKRVYGVPPRDYPSREEIGESIRFLLEELDRVS